MQHYVQQWMNVYITDSGVLLAVTIRMDAEALCEGRDMHVQRCPATTAMRVTSWCTAVGHAGRPRT